MDKTKTGHTGKIIRILLTIYMLVEIIALLFLSHNMDKNTQGALDGTDNIYEENWTYQSGGEDISFPFVDKEAETITLVNTLPEVTKWDYLILKRQFQEVEVFIDGKNIYKSPTLQWHGFKPSLGMMLIFVPMQPEYSGQQVEVQLTRINKSQNISVQDIYLCSQNEFALSFIRENSLKLLLVVTMIFGGILMILAYFALRRKMPGYEYKMFLFLGIFAVQMAIWIITDMQIFQLLTGLYAMGGMISFISFMLLPIPFVAFMSALCEQYNRVLLGAEVVVCVNFAIQMGLYMEGIFDISQMLWITHIIFVAVIVTIIIVILKQVRGSNSYHITGMLIAMAVMAVISCIAVLGYNLIPHFAYMELVLIGFLIFFVILSYVCVHKTYEFIEVGTRTKVYQKLAFIDTMTQMGNRRAFDRELHQLEKEEKNSNLTFAAFDLNSLKETNDKWGHQAGDDIISATGAAIRKAFEGHGTCYRIGGDEFVTITEIPDKELKRCVQVLDEETEKYNKEKPYNISIARGFALVADYPEKSLEEVWHVADKNMYLNKEKMKKQR